MNRPRLYIVGDPPPAPLRSEEKVPHVGGHSVLEQAKPAEKLPKRKIDDTVIPRDWQMSLPFDDKPTETAVLVVAMETMNGSTLRGLIRARKPAAVIDLRQLIRFDLPGTSREDIFGTLRAHQAHYVRDPLPWHQLDSRAFARLDGPVSNALVHEIVERSAGCILVFVYRQDEVRAIASHLTKVLSERMRTPWHIEEAR